ncbi:hypothetical protein PBP221_82140 (plasmid) [Paraburkholderia sp. 22B1P]|nr:hypothetical protein PBP221_82140 [Paraburkholderia sp. 22B1P]
MTKETTFRIDVQFGDCDPAGIVFFPNYLRWVDAAFHAHFIQCGLQRRREMALLPGCVGALPQASRWKNQRVTIPDFIRTTCSRIGSL